MGGIFSKKEITKVEKLRILKNLNRNLQVKISQQKSLKDQSDKTKNYNEITKLLNKILSTLYNYGYLNNQSTVMDRNDKIIFALSKLNIVIDSLKKTIKFELEFILDEINKDQNINKIIKKLKKIDPIFFNSLQSTFLKSTIKKEIYKKIASLNS
jgi:hypothetical protein